MLQSGYDLVVLLGVAAFILLALSILGGALAARKSFQVRQFQDLLFKAERKIDTLERRLFNVLNAVPVALIETDAHGKFTFANKAAHQLLGREESELVGLHFHAATWGITYPDGRLMPADLVPIARTLRGQTVKGFQHMLTPFGSQQKMLVSATSMPIMNRLGEVIGSTSALVELETTKGEGIDDLGGLWRGHWFAAATLPFWGLDARGRIIDINPAACEAFGMTREQALGQNWTQVFVANADFQTALDYLSALQDETATEARTSVSLSLKSTDHETLSRVTAWVVKTHEGGEHGMTLMAQPESAAVRLANLNESDAQELIDHRQTERARADLGVGVWHYDAEADTIVEDEGMRRLIGRATEGGPTLIADEDQARADTAFTELMRGERQEIALDIAVGDPQGEARWITLRGRSTTDVDGKPRIFGVAFDITAWHGHAPAAGDPPPPQPDYSTYEARIAALQDEVRQSHDLLAVLEKRYTALAEAPPPVPDVSIWETRLATAEARAVKLQAAHDDARSQAETASTRLDQLGEALNQAQKFETVGRLTADVAQDFAQMLSVINGALEIIATHEGSLETMRSLSEAALTAGKRGERLTRQLQAFQTEDF